jgi:hypothetical protein
MSMSILFLLIRFLTTHEKQHWIPIPQKEHISPPPPTFLKTPVIAKFRKQIFNLIFRLFGDA